MKSSGNKYTKTVKLGEGTYGVVYKAKDQKGNEIYGVSQIATPLVEISVKVRKKARKILA